MNERKRKSDDLDSLEFNLKKFRITDEIISILHYSYKSRKWTVLCASGDTQILDYHEVKNSPAFQQYIYDLLTQLRTHRETDASYIT